mmetsp:Transcript_13474/g.28082  ORF Transcript_13474/g.28082 Transcript_13474/m.28082 type:complete len:352 (-) Transcript_13474:169-1224(-)
MQGTTSSGRRASWHGPQVVSSPKKLSSDLSRTWPEARAFDVNPALLLPGRNIQLCPMTTIGTVMDFASCAHDCTDRPLELDDLVRVPRRLLEELSFEDSVCSGSVFSPWPGRYIDDLHHDLCLRATFGDIPSNAHQLLREGESAAGRRRLHVEHDQTFGLGPDVLLAFEHLHLPAAGVLELGQDLGLLAVEVRAALEARDLHVAAHTQLHRSGGRRLRGGRLLATAGGPQHLSNLLIRGLLRLLTSLRRLEGLVLEGASKHGEQATQNAVVPGSLPGVDAAGHAHDPLAVCAELDQVLRDMAAPRDVSSVPCACDAGITEGDDGLPLVCHVYQMLHQALVNLGLGKDQVVC